MTVDGLSADLLTTADDVQFMDLSPRGQRLSPWEPGRQPHQ